MRLEWVAGAVLVGLVGYKVWTQPSEAAHRLAPEGTFYVTDYISFPTDNGLTGVGPGETVHVIRAADGNNGWLHVASRNGEFDVKADHLTNDMDLADSLRLRDLDTQAGLQRGSVPAVQPQQNSQQTAQAETWTGGAQQTSVSMPASAPAGGLQPQPRNSAAPTSAAASPYSSSARAPIGTSATSATINHPATVTMDSRSAAIVPTVGSPASSGLAGKSVQDSSARPRMTPIGVQSAPKPPTSR